jgi:LCP family protein required for cell wall assembly
MPKKTDRLRIYAVLLLIGSIIYFYLFLLSPRSIPYFLRFAPLPKNMNILIMGTDTVYDKIKHVALKDMGHTDSMILMNINTANYKINMLSIPRDTLVEIPGYGWQKVNSAFFLGGPDLAIETVEKLLGVKVNHYVILNTRGLIKLIDLMGGIRIFVDKDMYYVDNWGGLKINLKKGVQTLNGEQAHGFIRFRAEPLGDVSRVQRQQEFMQTLLRKLATPSMLIRTPWVMAIAFENIRTDLSLKELLYGLNFARYLRKDDANMSIVPGEFSIGEANASIWKVDREQLHDIVNRYFSKKLLAKFEPPLAPSKSITIINNTEDFEPVKHIMKLLYKKEYAIVNVSAQKKEGVTTTRIIAQKGDRSSAEKLGQVLGISDIIVSGTGDLTTDFTIIVCKDWEQSLQNKLNATP